MGGRVLRDSPAQPQDGAGDDHRCRAPLSRVELENHGRVARACEDGSAEDGVSRDGAAGWRAGSDIYRALHVVGSRPHICPKQGRCGTFWYLSAMRNFDTLTEREVIALAISLEEEDERTYADYA